ncbi:hypothetical protein [Pseudomonas sp. ZL2]
MRKSVKWSVAAGCLLLTAILVAPVFVPPQRFLAVAVARNCIGLVERALSNRDGISIVSVSVTPGDDDKSRTKELPRIIESLVEKGRITLLHPEVLVDFDFRMGNHKALCSYDATHWVKDGRYTGVSLEYAQIDLQEISDIQLVMNGFFDVGYFKKLTLLMPIIGVEQKYYLE